MADGAQNVTITLPDGAERTYTTGVTGSEVAADISKSLGKAALACKIDGRLADLSEPIEADSQLAIVTIKDDAEAKLRAVIDEFAKDFA